MRAPMFQTFDRLFKACTRLRCKCLWFEGVTVVVGRLFKAPAIAFRRPGLGWLPNQLP